MTHDITTNDILVIIITVIGFIMAGYIYLTQRKNKHPPSSNLEIKFPAQFQPASKEKLLNMVFGDKQAAERLIQFERNRMPSASEKELIQMAIDRLERDRR